MAVVQKASEDDWPFLYLAIIHPSIHPYPFPVCHLSIHPFIHPTQSYTVPTVGNRYTPRTTKLNEHILMFKKLTVP